MSFVYIVIRDTEQEEEVIRTSMQIYANTFLEGEKWDRNWFRQDGKFRDKQRLVWNKLTTNSSCFFKGVTGNVWWLNWICKCSIVDKFRIHLRHIKRFYDVYLLSLSAKSTFKNMNLGEFVFKIVFFLNY